MSQRERHAQKLRLILNKLDKLGMLRRLASLKDSSPRRPAIARAMFIAGLAIAHSFASAAAVNTAVYQKPFNVYNKMNVKLYLHNTINDWDQFECAIELAHRESSWRYSVTNVDSGAYGLFQHMSKHARNWDVFKQIDKHNVYINRRYDGSWCKALNHLKGRGWH